MAALFRRHPRKIIAGGVLATGIALAEYLPNPFYTTGVANIEKRYSSGGGAPNHTPGSATKLGHPEHVEGNVEKSKGMGTPHWEEHIGGQKPEVRDENPSKFDQKWNETHYHAKKGK